jgi:hypothetical protein
MGKISISIEADNSDSNSIQIDNKSALEFEKKLHVFQEKWGKIVSLFEGRFLYVQKNISLTTYYFFKNEDETLNISSGDFYVENEDVPNFKRYFMKFLSQGEDDFFEYSFGLYPFEKEFYIDLFNLIKKYGEISFTAIVIADSESGYWESNYMLTKKGIKIEATYCD